VTLKKGNSTRTSENDSTGMTDSRVPKETKDLKASKDPRARQETKALKVQWESKACVGPMGMRFLVTRVIKETKALLGSKDLKDGLEMLDLLGEKA